MSDKSCSPLPWMVCANSVCSGASGPAIPAISISL